MTNIIAEKLLNYKFKLYLKIYKSNSWILQFEKKLIPEYVQQGLIMLNIHWDYFLVLHQ